MEFEGYKVPECTKEEVRKSAKYNMCVLYLRESATRCTDIESCRSCVCGLQQRRDGVTQRYLDHRWPKKVAVHCKTQEEWDAVCEKLGRPFKFAWDAHYAKGGSGCLNTEVYGNFSKKAFYEQQDYKIISAQEYLGEEKGVWRDRAILVGGQDSNNNGNKYLKFDPETMHRSGALVYYKTTNNSNTKEEDMSINKSIEKVYEKTADAVLVDKHFSNEIGITFAHYLILKDHKADYLKEAKRLKEESKDKE